MGNFQVAARASTTSLGGGWWLVAGECAHVRLIIWSFAIAAVWVMTMAECSSLLNAIRM